MRFVTCGDGRSVLPVSSGCGCAVGGHSGAAVSGKLAARSVRVAGVTRKLRSQSKADLLLKTRRTDFGSPLWIFALFYAMSLSLGSWRAEGGGADAG